MSEVPTTRIRQSQKHQRMILHWTHRRYRKPWTARNLCSNAWTLTWSILQAFESVKLSIVNLMLRICSASILNRNPMISKDRADSLSYQSWMQGYIRIPYIVLKSTCHRILVALAGRNQSGGCTFTLPQLQAAVKANMTTSCLEGMETPSCFNLYTMI